MIARKFEAHNPDPQLTVVTQPPRCESWFAIVRINNLPRIVMIDDVSTRDGFTRMKCLLMGSGTIIWVDESCLLQWVWPPTNLPKPVSFKLYDYVRLTTHEKAFIYDIQGDLIGVVYEDGTHATLARWDVLRVLCEANV